MKRISVWAVAVWLAGLGLAAAAQQTVTATGTAAILNHDAAQARDRAVESALRAAVEQVMGTMVDSESLVKNNDLVSDKIYTQTTGYIASYKVLTEKPDPDTNIYTVTVEAVVKEGDLEHDLGSLGVLMRRMKMPRVAVAIKEEGGGEAAATLLRLLKDRGFNVVDSGSLEQNFYGMPEDAQSDLLRKYGAEVVLIGTLRAGRGGSVAGSDLQSYQASLSVRALRTDTKHLLGTSSGSGKAVHIGDEGAAQAARQAANVAGNDIIRQITAQWAQEASSARQLVLTVRGVSPEEASKMAARLQKEGRGVKEATVRQAQGGEAQIELTLQGDAGDLAQEVKKLWPSVQVDSQTANSLTVSR